MNQTVVPPRQPMAKPQPRIVHESETQRQHIRIQIPIIIEVGETTFAVPDWSVGGLGVRDLNPAPEVNDIFEGKLRFPMKGFDFQIPVRCEVRHVTNGVTGCRFLDVTEQQASLLQYMVGAYISGELVSSNDLLSINARKNFAPERKSPVKSVQPGRRYVDAAKRILFAALLLAIGFALAGYLVAAVYQRLYVTTFDGYVGTPTSVYVRAPSDGVVDSMSIESMQAVQRGQVVGLLTDPEGRPQNLVAGCDCVAVAMPAPAGSVVQRGSPVAVLAQADAAPLFVVRAPSRLATGLDVGDRTSVTMFNGEASTGGTIVSLERYTPIDYATERNSPSLESYVILLIRPDRAFALDEYGEPVRVRIDRLQLFASDAPPPAQ